MASITQKQSFCNEGAHEARSRLSESLRDVAKRRNRHDVLSSFCERYLIAMLSKQVATNTSSEATFDALASAVDIRKELHDMERSMDKKYFSELLAGGYFVYANTDKESGLPIAWLRSGAAEYDLASSEAGRWRYRAGTPRSLAYLRYAWH